MCVKESFKSTFDARSSVKFYVVCVWVEKVLKIDKFLRFPLRFRGSSVLGCVYVEHQINMCRNRRASSEHRKKIVLCIQWRRKELSYLHNKKQYGSLINFFSNTCSMYFIGKQKREGMSCESAHCWKYFLAVLAFSVTFFVPFLAPSS